MSGHIPERMCCACRKKRPKHELIRFSKDARGNIVIDNDTRAGGRGAYICRMPECIAAAKKRKSLNRHFSCAVDESVYRAAEEFIDG